jgi:hypothetical protein
LNALGRSAALQQPHSGVHRRFASAEYAKLDRALIALPNLRELRRRDEAHAFRHFEFWRRCGGHLRREIGGIDQLCAHRNLRLLARENRGDVPDAPLSSQALHASEMAHGQIAHTLAGQQNLVHHFVKITRHFRAAGQFKQTRVVAHGVFAPRAQLKRIHTVKSRGLMQRDERVGIVPMATGLGMLVHDGDVRIALLEQRIGKRQASRASADDEVVGVEGRHTLSRCWYEESEEYQHFAAIYNALKCKRHRYS